MSRLVKRSQQGRFPNNNESKPIAWLESHRNMARSNTLVGSIYLTSFKIHTISDLNCYKMKQTY